MLPLEQFPWLKFFQNKQTEKKNKNKTQLICKINNVRNSETGSHCITIIFSDYTLNGVDI